MEIPGKTVKLTLKGKTLRKWASGQTIYECEKKVILILFWGYIHMTFVGKQTYWCISQILGPMVLWLYLSPRFYSSFYLL